MSSIEVFENILSSDECLFIINKISKIKKWDEGGGSFWTGRSLSPSSLYNKHNEKDLSLFMLEIEERIKNNIIDRYDISKNIYSDLIQIAKWNPGLSLEPHVDSMLDDPDSSWFHHREYASILYLNDSFIGGETYYPDHNKKIKPKAGSMVIHPADFMHGVTEVISGIRYTINSFWTSDYTYKRKWTPPQSI